MVAKARKLLVEGTCSLFLIFSFKLRLLAVSAVSDLHLRHKPAKSAFPKLLILMLGALLYLSWKPVLWEWRSVHFFSGWSMLSLHSSCGRINSGKYIVEGQSLE